MNKWERKIGITIFSGVIICYMMLVLDLPFNLLGKVAILICLTIIFAIA